MAVKTSSCAESMTDPSSKALYYSNGKLSHFVDDAGGNFRNEARIALSPIQTFRLIGQDITLLG